MRPLITEHSWLLAACRCTTSPNTSGELKVKLYRFCGFRDWSSKGQGMWLVNQQCSYGFTVSWTWELIFHFAQKKTMGGGQWGKSKRLLLQLNLRLQLMRFLLLCHRQFHIVLTVSQRFCSTLLVWWDRLSFILQGWSTTIPLWATG